VIAADSDPYAYATAQGANAHCTIVRDPGTALGYYLHALETHGFPEPPVMDALGGAVDLTPYEDMQASLTRQDRRLKLMDLWEWRAADDGGGDGAAARYFEAGATWRGRGLTESGLALADELAATTTQKPGQCYYTAGEAAITYADNHRVTYVEGMCLPATAGQAIRHAWLEIDGAVTELTWPWHPVDGWDAVYIGVEVPTDEVRARRRDGAANGAVVLSPDEARRVGGAMRGGGE